MQFPQRSIGLPVSCLNSELRTWGTVFSRLPFCFANSYVLGAFCFEPRDRTSSRSNIATPSILAKFIRQPRCQKVKK